MTNTTNSKATEAVIYLRDELADAHDDLRRLDRCDPDYAVEAARLRGRVAALAEAIGELPSSNHHRV